MHTSLWSSLPAWALPPVPWMLLWNSKLNVVGLFSHIWLGVEGHRASLPAGRGAIIRVWLQNHSSAPNAASRHYAHCYPRTTAPVPGSQCVVILTWPGAWHCFTDASASCCVIYLKLSLLFAARRAVMFRAATEGMQTVLCVHANTIGVSVSTTAVAQYEQTVFMSLLLSFVTSN